MIIWRGWGVVAVGFFLLAGILGVAIPFNLWGDAAKWVLAPVAVLCGIGCWLVGNYLNVTKPQRVLDVEIPRLREEVRQSVDAGTFRLANQPPPTSRDQAIGQAQAYLATAEASMGQRRNANTLFWIPVQYWGFIIAAWGIAMPLLLR